MIVIKSDSSRALAASLSHYSLPFYFNEDSTHAVITCQTPVYVYDMTKRQCVHRDAFVVLVAIVVTKQTDAKR